MNVNKVHVVLGNVRSIYTNDEVRQQDEREMMHIYFTTQATTTYLKILSRCRPCEKNEKKQKDEAVMNRKMMTIIRSVV